MRGSTFVVVLVAVLAMSACGSSDKAPATVTAAPSTVTVQATPTAVAPAPVQPSPVQSSAAPVAAAGPWVMPNVIGQDLQAAQNTIQALTEYNVFFSGSKDLTGKGRMQINDRNWQVCSSTPPTGSAITAQTSVEFGVVKESESCP